MSSAVLLLVGLVSAPVTAAADSLDSVAAVALAAVEGDSIESVRKRFETHLGGPSDAAGQLGLAYLALYTYDYAAAEARFRAVRDASATGKSLAAHARLGLAQTALAQAQVARGDTLLGEAISAARLAREPLIEADALLLSAVATARIRGVSEAWSALARADSLLLTKASLRPRVTCVRAQLTSRSDVGAALALALDGAKAARTAGDLRTEGTCLFVAGGALMTEGNTDSAVTLFGGAADVQRRAHDRAGLAATLQWHGYTLLDAGSYAESRAALTRALVEGEASGNLSPVAWGHLILAMLGLATGEFEAVATDVAQAESLFRQNGDATGIMALANVEVQRARVVGDTATARSAAARFAEGAIKFGWHWPVFAQRELAFVAMDAGEWASARSHLDSALVHARKLGAAGLELSVVQDQGVLALRAGNPREARTILERVIPQISADEASFRHYTLTQLAVAQLRLGETDSASATALRAADELDRWREGLDDRRLRQTAFDLRRFEDPSFAVADVIAGLAAAGRTEVAFDLAERRRARHLLDRMVLAVGMAATPADAPRASATVLGSRAISQSIPDDSTVILEFVRGGAGSSTTVFVISPGGLRAVVLPPGRELGRRVRRFTGLLETGARADSLARSLGDELVVPVLPAIPPGATRLVIVPDLELHGLPFEALRIRDDVLLARYSVSYAPSASVISRLWQRQRTPGPATVLAFGDPRFAEEVEPGSAAQVFRSAFDRAGGLPRLRASAGEARTVARYADRADVHLRDDASEAALKETPLAQFRVIHLATHALVDDWSPGRSALALAAGHGEDGFVSPSEIAELTLGADLLVLSGCRTARGMVAGGEGVDGLATPALEAGARAVLASVWLVGDQETAAFMEQFYDHVAAGLPIGQALQATKLNLMRAGGPAGAWASFTLLGDPHTRIALHPPAPRFPWTGVLPIIVLLAALAYGVLMVRRRGGDTTSAPSGSRAATTQR
jgi:tetratricopeptide (TPR) repeat protein